MNPCIDCHTLMLKIAGKKMEEMGHDFIFTGEVLGQRPMSQSRQMLHVVAKNSGYADRILRPLSARLLPETLPEKEGKVDRERLLDIQGRGRKRQMEMAERYGITEYANPAGGCLLTDPMFSKRLRDLFASHPGFTPRDLELLKVGRHIRLNDRHKVIVGRNKRDNQSLGTPHRRSGCRLPDEGLPRPALHAPRRRARGGGAGGSGHLRRLWRRPEGRGRGDREVPPGG